MSESNRGVCVEAEAGPERGLGPAVVGPGSGAQRSDSWAAEALKWVFSFPAMLGTALVGLVFSEGRTFITDSDMWWHIKVGQSILATHQWPTRDIYSFTAYGRPWVAEEWLGEVLMARAWRLDGLRALDLLLIGLDAAVIIGLYILAAKRSNAKAGFLATALFCPLAWTSFTLRPQMLAYFFLVLTMIVLALFREGKTWAIWSLPPIFLLWVNTHGLWLIGLGVVFLYWICGLMEFRIGAVEVKRWSTGQRRQISLALLLSVAMLPITPYGTELAAIPFRFMFSLPLAKSSIQEWQPISFNTSYGHFFLGLFLAFLVLQTILELRWRLDELLLFFAAIALACMHVRFLLLFVPFGVPLLARIFALSLQSYDRAIDKHLLNGILMVGTVMAMVHYFPSRAALEANIAATFPVRAVEYMQEHSVPGPTFNPDVFGGYLIWADPQQKVFIDGRAELYESSGVLEDYTRLVFLKPGALDVLRRYQIRSCLLGRDDALSTALAASPYWRKVYSDRTSTLFVIAGMAGAEAAATRGWDSQR